MSELDLSYLNEISGGDRDFIVDMVETFLEETPKDVENLKREAAAGNWTEVGLVAHKLKSSVKMFGFETTKNLILEIELDGKQQSNIDKLPEKVDRFLTLIDGVMTELRAEL